MPGHHTHVFRYLLSAVLLVTFSSLPAPAPEAYALGATAAPPQDAKAGLTNADIVEMIKAGLPESTIILAIRKEPANLDTSAQALIQLKKQGATQKILDAMLESQAGAAATTGGGGSPAPPGFGEAPRGELPLGVILVDGAQRIQMTMSTPDTRVSTGGMMRVVNPLKKIRNRNTLTGSRAQLRTANHSPLFETALLANINPSDQIIVVKLIVKSERRELDVGRTTMMGGVTTEIREKDKVAVVIEEVRTEGQMKVYRFKPATPLPPGEYAVMLSAGFYDFGIDVAR